MKRLFFALLLCIPLSAQTLSFVNHDTGTAIGSTFQFSDTPQYGTSILNIQVSNPGNASLKVTFSLGPQSTSNFVLTGTSQQFVLAPLSANSERFTIYFNPQSSGPASADLVLTSTPGDCTANCQGSPATAITFTGNGTAAQLVPTYSVNGAPRKL